MRLSIVVAVHADSVVAVHNVPIPTVKSAPAISVLASAVQTIARNAIVVSVKIFVIWMIVLCAMARGIVNHTAIPTTIVVTVSAAFPTTIVVMVPAVITISV